MNYKQVMELMDDVLLLNRKSLFAKLEGKSLEPEEFQKARKSCAKLNELDIYPFRVECTDEELLNQIRNFIQNAFQ